MAAPTNLTDLLASMNVTIPDGPASPSGTKAIIAIVQMGFFCIMGPIVLLYGPVILRVVIFMQSLFASEYALFINTFATVEVETIWDSFSRLVFLVTGTITLAFAAIRGEKIRGVLNGATLGILVSVPLMAFVSNLLFTQWAKCEMTGPPNKEFPNGSPQFTLTGTCTAESTEYMVSFHLSKGLEWLIIFIFAKIGQAKIWVYVSSAMAGATMFLTGLIDLIQLILGYVEPSLIPDTLVIMGSVRTFVGYGLAGAGAFVQLMILETKKKPGGKSETKLKEHGKAKFCNILLKPPLSHMLWLLSKLDNVIMKAMEGKMKLAPGNSLNPAMMGEALKEMGGDMAEGVALKAAIKASQPLLEPILSKIGLAFKDVEMIFNREITELEDAKEVASDPMAFLTKVWKMDKAMLIPSMMNKLGPMFDPTLTKALLVWDDVKDTVNETLVQAESLSDVIEQLAKPELILEHPKIKAKIEQAKAKIEEAQAAGTPAAKYADELPPDP